MGFTSPLIYQASLKTSLMSYCSAPQPVPRAAAVSDVTYTADIKFPSGCPCKDKQHDTKGNLLVAYVSYTAVSISLRAKNAASSSPTVTKHIPDVSTSDLRGKACVRVSVCVSKCNEQFSNSKPKRHFLLVTPACKNTSLAEKFKKGTCLQLYELQDGDQGPKKVITLTAKMDKRQRKPSEKPH